MQVSSLMPGATFRVDLGPYGYIDYKLLNLNQCRAYVEPIGRPKREIKNSDGDVVAEVEDRSGRCNISPGTEIIPIKLENNMSDASAPVIMKRGGDRFFPPSAQERPVREGTTRHKMLTMLLDDPTGEVDIKEVMKTFEMDRNLVVAHVHEMWKRHGYGYSISGDMIAIAEPLKVELEDLL